MRQEKCLVAMLRSLEKLNVTLDTTDFFITHLHADHVGLLGDLATNTSRMYMSRVEAAIVSSVIEEPEKRGQQANEILFSHGFPAEELRKAMQDHPGYRFIPKRPIDFCGLKEGDSIEVGDYSFRCIETPGHSPCHMCLYEEKRKILVSGDHLLFDITPNITFWLERENSLQEYLASLQKIYSLEVDLVLPGHRNVSCDHRTRIKELQNHHQSRLNEVVAALGEGEKTAWEVAPFITWDLGSRSWSRFPPAQKWFALGETIAHLDYLEQEGKISKAMVNGRVVYSLG